MALSASPFAVASASPASNVGVVPSASVPDNCHTVIVYNPSGATPGLVGRNASGTPLVAGVNAVSIPAGASLTLALGTIAQRGTMDPAVFGGSGLVYGTTGAVALPLQIAYLCSFGPV
jgi:hypothetical protein